MRQQHKPLLIFSVHRSTDTEAANLLEHHELRGYLHQEHIAFKECIGSYYGCIELSFIVDADHTAEVLTIALQHAQDSILYLDQDCNAELIFPCDSRPNEALGRFKRITQAEAFDLDAWTYDKSTDSYYAAS